MAAKGMKSRKEEIVVSKTHPPSNLQFDHITSKGSSKDNPSCVYLLSLLLRIHSGCTLTIWNIIWERRGTISGETDERGVEIIFNELIFSMDYGGVGLDTVREKNVLAMLVGMVLGMRIPVWMDKEWTGWESKINLGWMVIDEWVGIHLVKCPEKFWFKLFIWDIHLGHLCVKLWYFAFMLRSHLFLIKSLSV